MEIIAGKPSSEMLGYLLKRRSVMAAELKAPGPDADQLHHILAAASRGPDHGKVVPFYFLVFQGGALMQAGEILADAYATENPDCDSEKLEKERGRFARAPLVVAIVMRARKSKNPLWEQMLTCGAVAQNFLLAANALGFGAQWLTEWYAYNDEVREKLGLDDRDVIAGFMYVGSFDQAPEERERPDLNLIVNHWSQYAEIKKGDDYNRDKFDYPALGFDVGKVTRD